MSGSSTSSTSTASGVSLPVRDHPCPSQAWLTTARTLQPLDGLPAGTVATAELGDIETQLPVSDPDAETYMHASCAQALWIEFADGTFEERLDCTPHRRAGRAARGPGRPARTTG